MEPETITIESLTGWGGLETNQRKIAFQWLYYQDKQLGGNRIKHSHNGKSNGKAMEKSKWMVMTLRPKQCTSSTVVSFTDAKSVNRIIDTSQLAIIQTAQMTKCIKQPKWKRSWFERQVTPSLKSGNVSLKKLDNIFLSEVHGSIIMIIIKIPHP